MPVRAEPTVMAGPTAVMVEFSACPIATHKCYCSCLRAAFIIASTAESIRLLSVRIPLLRRLLLLFLLLKVQPLP